MQGWYTRVQGLQIVDDDLVHDDDDAYKPYVDDAFVIMMAMMMIVNMIMITLKSSAIHWIWTLDYTDDASQEYAMH